MDIISALQSVINSNLSYEGDSIKEHDMYHVINYQKSLFKELQEVLKLDTCSKEMVIEYLNYEIETDIADLRFAVKQLIDILANMSL